MPPSRQLRWILILSLVLVLVSLTAPLPSPAPTGQVDAPPPSGTPRQPAVDREAGLDGAEAPGQPPAATSLPSPSPAILRVAYRIEVRSPDPGVADAHAVIPAVLEDPRGWQQADIDFVQDPAAPYAIVVVEGEEAQALCHPYDVSGRFSCQNGPLVVLNAIRWREAVEHWPGDLASYRAMLVNQSTRRPLGPWGPAKSGRRVLCHEVGHLLGMHHLRCTAPGTPAPVMEQQSGTLRGCHANPWPTDIELRLAATHQFALAPPPQDVAFPP